MNVVHENTQNRLNSAIVFARGEIRVTERETHASFVAFFPGESIIFANEYWPPIINNSMNIEVHKHVG